MSLSLTCLLVRSIGIVNIIALTYCDLLWLKEELTEAVNIADFVSEICVCACVFIFLFFIFFLGGGAVILTYETIILGILGK